jgi:hypothetical protein
MTNAELKAQELVANNAKELDLNRHYSFPCAKNFVDERVNSKSVQHTYTNELSTAKKIVFGTLINSMFADEASLLNAVGGDVLVNDGSFLSGTSDKSVIISSADGQLKVGDLMRFGSNSPFRIIKSLYDARKLDGTESSAFTATTIESIFVSPVDTIRPTKMQLSKFLDGNKFNNGIVTIDYGTSGFPFHVSPETFVVLTIPAETTLNVTHEIGAMDSSSQRLYRATKTADSIVRPLLNM